MRGKWFLWLLAALIGSALAFPPMIFAAEKKAAEPSAPAKMEEKKAPEKAKAKARSATGDLVSADTKTGMMAVKVKDKEMSFTADTKAAKEALGKVKVGDRVTVSYTEKEGKMMASSVKTAKAPAKKAEKKAEKKEKKEGKK